MITEMIRILNSVLFHWFFLSGAILIIIFGAIMLYGIKKKGKVIIIGALLKNKHYDNEKLLGRYLFQAFYTIFLGACLFIVAVLNITTGVIIMGGVLIIGVLDGLYDYLAIKAVLKYKKDDTGIETQK
ncbi:MAG: hypothetical protein V1761_03910 [bacterium]